MQEPTTINLELDGRSLPVQIRWQGRSASPHTGKTLAELHGWVSTTEAGVHAWLRTVLRDCLDRPVRATDESGDFAGKWLVSWNAYAETDGNHTYTLILVEAEELSLDALLLGELELHPYEYRERIVGGGLTLWTKLVGTQDDLEQLRLLVQEHRILPVVRRGISDEPREMRLGAAEWSSFEDRVKYRLVLVDREVNEEMRAELARVEQENSQAALGYYENFAELLANLLVERGVVSRAEVDQLREAARSAPGVVRSEFWRVPDVDAL